LQTLPRVDRQFADHRGAIVDFRKSRLDRPDQPLACFRQCNTPGCTREKP